MVGVPSGKSFRAPDVANLVQDLLNIHCPGAEIVSHGNPSGLCHILHFETFSVIEDRNPVEAEFENMEDVL